MDNGFIINPWVFILGWPFTRFLAIVNRQQSFKNVWVWCGRWVWLLRTKVGSSSLLQTSSFFIHLSITNLMFCIQKLFIFPINDQKGLNFSKRRAEILSLYSLSYFDFDLTLRHILFDSKQWRRKLRQLEHNWRRHPLRPLLQRSWRVQTSDGTWRGQQSISWWFVWGDHIGWVS